MANQPTLFVTADELKVAVGVDVAGQLAAWLNSAIRIHLDSESWPDARPRERKDAREDVRLARRILKQARPLLELLEKAAFSHESALYPDVAPRVDGVLADAAASLQVLIDVSTEMEASAVAAATRAATSSGPSATVRMANSRHQLGRFICLGFERLGIKRTNWEDSAFARVLAIVYKKLGIEMPNNRVREIRMIFDGYQRAKPKRSLAAASPLRPTPGKPRRRNGRRWP